MTQEKLIQGFESTPVLRDRLFPYLEEIRRYAPRCHGTQLQVMKKGQNRPYTFGRANWRDYNPWVNLRGPELNSLAGPKLACVK